MWLSGVVTSNPQWFNEYTTNLFHNVLFYFQIFAWDKLMFKRLMVRIHYNISVVYSPIDWHIR